MACAGECFVATQQPETDSFLAAIDRKIAALQKLAASYREAQAVGALAPTGDVPVAAVRVGRPPKSGQVTRRSPQRKGALSAPASLPFTRAKFRAGGKTAMVFEALVSRGNAGATSEELHQVLLAHGAKCPVNYVFNILSRLRSQTRVEKRADGRWYPTATAA